jgi:radical SAM superfamily enzyme YgiQ (UPF0313 family)
MRELKVLLVGPYKGDKLRAGQFLAPPCGLYRIASFLRKTHGISSDIYDCDLDGLEGLFGVVQSKQYDFIGFSILYPTIVNSMNLINTVKSLSPNSIIIAGGQGASFSSELIFSKSMTDIIVKGFGEYPISEIINAYSKESSMDSFREIKGLFLKVGSSVIETPLRPPYTSEQFREIANSFDHSIVPYEKYWGVMEKVYPEEQLKVMKNDDFLYTIRIMTSSHCPMKCSFCSSTNFLDTNTNVQCALSMTPDDVINSIKSAIHFHPKTTAIYLVDDNLLQNKERLKKICIRIIEEFSDKKLSFFCLGRVDNIDEDLLSLMKLAGFKLIIYGVESFSDKVLGEMKKKIAGEASKTAINAIKNTLKYKMTPLMNFILFYPSSLVEDVIDTIETAVDLVSLGARLTVYSYVEVYPGAKILEEKGFDIEYKEFEVTGEKIMLPWLILPLDKKMKEAAKKALMLRDGIVAEIKNKYNFTEDLPHPVYALTLFWAFYVAVNKDPKRIELLVGELMKNVTNSVSNADRSSLYHRVIS